MTRPTFGQRLLHLPGIDDFLDMRFRAYRAARPAPVTSIIELANAYESSAVRTGGSG